MILGLIEVDILGWKLQFINLMIVLTDAFICSVFFGVIDHFFVVDFGSILWSTLATLLSKELVFWGS